MTRILIVEDEPRIAAFVSRGLESAGYETTVIEDGAHQLADALGLRFAGERRRAERALDVTHRLDGVATTIKTNQA